MQFPQLYVSKLPNAGIRSENVWSLPVHGPSASDQIWICITKGYFAYCTLGSHETAHLLRDNIASLRSRAGCNAKRAVLLVTITEDAPEQLWTIVENGPAADAHGCGDFSPSEADAAGDTVFAFELLAELVDSRQ